MSQSFVRAHGEQQKAVRVDQIVEKALALYDRIGYDRFTFSKLSEGLNFTRINLYTYFKTKEELFLEVARRDFDALIADARKVFSDGPLDAAAYVSRWTDLMTRNSRCIDLLVLLNTQVLRNVSEELHRNYQHYLLTGFTGLADTVHSALPSLTKRQAQDLTAFQFHYAEGIKPIATRVATLGQTPSTFITWYGTVIRIALCGILEDTTDEDPPELPGLWLCETD